MTDTVKSAVASGKPRTSPQFLRKAAPYVFIGPSVVYLIVFTLIPLVDGLRLSLTDAELVNPSGGQYLGFKNYQRLLADDAFWSSVGITLVYTLVTVVFAVGVGAAAAILLDSKFRGRAVVRGIVAIPYAVPTVATALIFSWIYYDEGGILNRISQALGLGQHGWLITPKIALVSVLFATVWVVFPIVMLVVLASLQGVPHELREATWLDGANRFQSFKAVTWPHIRPVVQVMALLMTIWSIRRFEIIFLLTGGGPLDSTNTLVVNIYRTAFQNQRLGTAAAIGGLGLALSLAVTGLYFFMQSWQERKDR